MRSRSFLASASLIPLTVPTSTAREPPCFLQRILLHHPVMRISTSRTRGPAYFNADMADLSQRSHLVLATPRPAQLCRVSASGSFGKQSYITDVKPPIKANTHAFKRFAVVEITDTGTRSASPSQSGPCEKRQPAYLTAFRSPQPITAPSPRRPSPDARSLYMFTLTPQPHSVRGGVI
jgi:hypothetical protein